MQNATSLINLIAKLIYATQIHFDQRLVFFYLMFHHQVPVRFRVVPAGSG